MSQPATKKYPAAFKERAVKLAVESDQAIAQTARDRGVNENTLHTWIGKYHRAERQEQQVQDEHVYEELKRLRKENARLKEEESREMLDFLPFVKPDFYFFTCSFEHVPEKVSEQGYTACDHVTWRSRCAESGRQCSAGLAHDAVLWPAALDTRC